MRFRFWLLMMEVTGRIFGWHSPQYAWTLGKATEALERYWRLPEDRDDSEVPF